VRKAVGWGLTLLHKRILHIVRLELTGSAHLRQADESTVNANPLETLWGHGWTRMDADRKNRIREAFLVCDCFSSNGVKFRPRKPLAAVTDCLIRRRRRPSLSVFSCVHPWPISFSASDTPSRGVSPEEAHSPERPPCDHALCLHRSYPPAAQVTVKSRAA
jgi:hypothetical protein